MLWQLARDTVGLAALSIFIASLTVWSDVLIGA